MSAVPASAPGWRAGLELGFARDGTRTIPVHRRHFGPLRVQKAFHPEPGVCHSYILHPPGGVVGGDRLNTTVDVAGDAHALITTPGANKFYRSGGPVACQRQTLRVADGGTLEWLPLEQIVFDGAQAEATLAVELAGDARFIGWEVTCLGRPAGALPFVSGRFDARLRIHRDGRPLLHERNDLAAGSGLLSAPWGLGGAEATGILLATGADDAAVTAVRELLPADAAAGVTRLDDVLVLRWAGDGAEAAFALLRAAWAVLRPRLLDRPACEPRIWRT